jgi:hypothetical protein
MKKLTPVRAIKQYCKEQCCAGDLKSWKNCSFTKCMLYNYRLGKRGTGTNKRPDINNIIETNILDQKVIASYHNSGNNKQLEVMQ